MCSRFYVTILYLEYKILNFVVHTKITRYTDTVFDHLKNVPRGYMYMHVHSSLLWESTLKSVS